LSVRASRSPVPAFPMQIPCFAVRGFAFCAHFCNDRPKVVPPRLLSPGYAGPFPPFFLPLRVVLVLSLLFSVYSEFWTEFVSFLTPFLCVHPQWLFHCNVRVFCVFPFWALLFKMHRAAPPPFQFWLHWAPLSMEIATLLPRGSVRSLPRFFPSGWCPPCVLVPLSWRCFSPFSLLSPPPTCHRLRDSTCEPRSKLFFLPSSSCHRVTACFFLARPGVSISLLLPSLRSGVFRVLCVSVGPVNTDGPIGFPGDHSLSAILRLVQIPACQFLRPPPMDTLSFFPSWVGEDPINAPRPIRPLNPTSLASPFFRFCPLLFSLAREDGVGFTLLPTKCKAKCSRLSQA